MFTKDHNAGLLNNTISYHQIIFHCQKLKLYFKTETKYIEIERLTDTNIDRYKYRHTTQGT